MDPFIKNLFNTDLEDSIETVITYSMASDAK